MQARPLIAVLAFAASAFVIAGCGSSGGGGGGGGGAVLPTPAATATPPGSTPTPPATPTPPGATPTPNAQSDSIAAMNAAGSPVLADQDLETAQSSPKARGGGPPPNGVCTQLPQGSAAYEFFTRSATSTERIVYYDTACTQMATDVVRTFTPVSSTSETVTRTVTRYLQNGTKVGSRTENITYSNGSFDSYGYPTVDTGLIRSSVSNVTLTPPGGNTFQMTQDDEFIVNTAQSGNILTFCADTAGVNAIGNFGIVAQTDSSNATITQNNDTAGSVTFQMTRLGSLYTNNSSTPMSLVQGTQNTVCPIATPWSSVTGGTTRGSYTMPITITIANINGTAIPQVTTMTVNSATFPNGETLNVVTQGGSITGTLTGPSGTMSTFTVNGWGEGKLYVGPTATWQIDQWHVGGQLTT
ncbi:MAG: hypothetical protein JO092_00315 [Candidatus Eremiobacteraeota bacterium]|nr:hypothetical protein [Candidatus Eremiobacteraeota bacterium]